MRRPASINVAHATRRARGAKLLATETNYSKFGNTNGVSMSVPLGAWCSSCGRERDDSGRCPNCDSWWKSPLLTVGGPLIALTLMGMATLISFTSPLRGADGGYPTIVRKNSAPAAAADRYSPAGGNSPFYFGTPAATPAAPRPALPLSSAPSIPVSVLYAPPPSVVRERDAWARHAALLQMTREAEYAAGSLVEQEDSISGGASFAPATEAVAFNGI